MDIKLISWNIWRGVYLPAVTDFLKSSNADIIALQEVEETDEYVNTASTLADSLDYEYVYARSMAYEIDGIMRYFGNAILSKHHIAGSRSHALSEEQTRTAMQADIAVNDSVLHAVSAHLIHSHQQPSLIQEQQMKNLVSAVPKENTVIMGDFNSLPESRAIEYMKHAFTDTDDSHVPTWCLYPEGCEQCRIDQVLWKLDYIFVSPAMKSHNFMAGESKGSDHLPISVILAV